MEEVRMNLPPPQLFAVAVVVVGYILLLLQTSHHHYTLTSASLLQPPCTLLVHVFVYVLWSVNVVSAITETFPLSCCSLAALCLLMNVSQNYQLYWERDWWKLLRLKIGHSAADFSFSFVVTLICLYQLLNLSFTCSDCLGLLVVAKLSGI